MDSIRFSAMLKIIHASVSLGAATQEFSVVPDKHWNVGDPHIAPDSSNAPGVFGQSFWCATLASGGASEDVPFAERLNTLAINLQSHADFFRALPQDAEVALSLTFHSHYEAFGFELAADAMRILGALGIHVHVDVYSRESP